MHARVERTRSPPASRDLPALIPQARIALSPGHACMHGSNTPAGRARLRQLQRKRGCEGLLRCKEHGLPAHAARVRLRLF